MEKKNSFRFSLDADFCILSVFAIFILPFPWITAWLVAACIHELSHCVALCIFKIRIYSVRIASSGAIIETEQMNRWQELLTALAGPVGGLCLLLFYRNIPHIAVCALIQSIFNLLPIYPMDGGRAFRAILGLIFADILVEKISVAVSVIIYLFATILACFCAVHLNAGIFPILFAFVFIYRSLKLNIPCKLSGQIVQ